MASVMRVAGLSFASVEEVFDAREESLGSEVGVERAGGGYFLKKLRRGVGRDRARRSCSCAIARVTIVR